MKETDYKFKFYLVNESTQLVFGFDDKKEAEFYKSVLNNYTIISYERAVRFNLNPKNIENWSDTVPQILKDLLEDEKEMKVQ